MRKQSSSPEIYFLQHVHVLQNFEVFVASDFVLVLDELLFLCEVEVIAPCHAYPSRILLGFVSAETNDSNRRHERCV